MRNTRTILIALTSGAALLTAACSKNANETTEASTAKSEAPSAVASDVPVVPSTASPSDTRASASPAGTSTSATPDSKAPAAK